MERRNRGETKYIGFWADKETAEYIKKQNDIIYAENGRSSQTKAICELVKVGAKAKGL